eukprot:3941947-Rhodomonas_salina.7
MDDTDLAYCATSEAKKTPKELRVTIMDWDLAGTFLRTPYAKFGTDLRCAGTRIARHSRRSGDTTRDYGSDH